MRSEFEVAVSGVNLYLKSKGSKYLYQDDLNFILENIPELIYVIFDYIGMTVGDVRWYINKIGSLNVGDLYSEWNVECLKLHYIYLRHKELNK